MAVLKSQAEEIASTGRRHNGAEGGQAAGAKGTMGIEVWVEPGGELDPRPREQEEGGEVAPRTTGRPRAERGSITWLLDRWMLRGAGL